MPPVTPAEREALVARLKTQRHSDDGGCLFGEILDGKWDGHFFGHGDYAPETLAAYEALDADWRARNPEEAALWP